MYFNRKYETQHFTTGIGIDISHVAFKNGNVYGLGKKKDGKGGIYVLNVDYYWI